MTPPAVLVVLRGGLGNQMFQYAVGRAIAERHGRTLVLDDLALAVDHQGRTKRSYTLDVFDIDARLTSIEGPFEAAVRAVFVQESPRFHGHVLEPSSSPLVELRGFWQSELYFAGIAPLLRQQFRMKPGPWDKSRWATRIAAAANPVAVHVRRGDYLTPAGAVLGFVGGGYYDRAAAEIARRAADPHFFVFSDDPDWCRENLRFPAAHDLVAHEGDAQDHALTDFRLMTLCRHFVIANSSFSWWAAWLAGHPDKTVVAPLRWYEDPGLSSGDVIPDGWIPL